MPTPMEDKLWYKIALSIFVIVVQYLLFSVFYYIKTH